MPATSPTAQIGGPAVVFALVLAEVAIGGLAILWLVPAWGRVRDGFFKLAGATIAASAVLAWLAARAPLLDRDAGNAATTNVLLAAFAGATVLWQLLLYARVRPLSRAVGIAAVPVGVAALVSIATDPVVSRSAVVAMLQLLGGAVFVGAAVDGLLLGHWHLVDRKAAREPLARINQIFIASAPVAALAVLLGGTGAGTARADLSPLLGVGVLTVSIAVGLTALCMLIAFFIRALIREDSMQSATGLFYLAVLMGSAAEFAAKVRFF